jgi:hypothetical protein
VLTARDIQDMDFSNLEKHGAGYIGGDPVWDAINELSEMFDNETLAAINIDRLLIERTRDGALYYLPRVDMITLLGCAALLRLERQLGVIKH